jgi:hypothetical protein
MRSESYDEPLLPSYLEADQLVAETSRPVAPARLPRRAMAGLWALRVFAIVMGALVIYVFVSQLSS